MPSFPLHKNRGPETSATFVLRIAGSPSRVIDAAKAAIADCGPSVGIEFRPFSAQLKESISREKLMATLSGAFGVLAGLLASLGLYGVIAYMVERRRNEIGLRIALGADRGHVIGLVIREAMVLLTIGLAAGLVLALSAGKAVSTLLFGLQPNDLVSLTAASGLLACIALIASYAPARRAASIQPMSALRNE